MPEIVDATSGAELDGVGVYGKTWAMSRSAWGILCVSTAVLVWSCGCASFRTAIREAAQAGARSLVDAAAEKIVQAIPPPEKGLAKTGDIELLLGGVVGVIGLWQSIDRRWFHRMSSSASPAGRSSSNHPNTNP